MTRARTGLRRTFESLDTYNYRLYFAGDLVSHVGGWMQTMAEAWLVLQLTHDGAAVGATFAFRFLPVAVFGLYGGAVADRFDRRKLLVATQLCAAALAAGLWAVVETGVVRTWMVYAFAVGLGLVTVIDEPAHHAFVEEMVGPERVANAVALNSAVANSARITGPALAGVLISRFGAAWVFFGNAVSFLAVVGALLAMRTHDLDRPPRATSRPRVREGMRYAWSLTDIRSTILLVGVVGTLVYNFPTTLTMMADRTFHGGAGLAGFLMALLGIGTVIGALRVAHLASPTRRGVIAGAVMLGTVLLVAASLPWRVGFEIALIPLGALAVYFGSLANGHLQVASAPELRGRVMSIYTSLTLGTTVVGGPFIGWVSQRWSARVGLALAGGATVVAALLVLVREARRSVA